MSSDPVVIVAAKRTPLGAFQGALSAAASPDLAAAAIRACVEESGIDITSISEVLLGCVLPAGVGQAPARQAAIKAGIPLHAGCTTLNKVCGSGMKATMFGHDMVKAGSANVVIAGGMESMSNAPYLMPKARAGYRMGHQQVLDHMFFDGLQNPSDGNMMGHFAEETAKKYGFTRAQQDEFAIESVTRARAALAGGLFDSEIAAVTISGRKGDVTVIEDEGPTIAKLEKIPNLRPAFAEAEKRGLQPLATIVGHSGFAHEPEWFTTAPVFAIKALHEKLGWSPDTVDLYEINEAFACVTMAAMTDVGLDHSKVNVNGGACALGHPIGATGARIIVTLLHALRNRGLQRGVASLCIGGGEAVAIGLEVN
jgi:acetyl-CoA C-acetyltransferase